MKDTTGVERWARREARRRVGHLAFETDRISRFRPFGRPAHANLFAASSAVASHKGTHAFAEHKAVY